ncbi:hypothetical protein GCM10026988_32990 [Vibrio panuliri]
MIEELQAVTVEFNVTPRVSLNQASEALLELVGGERVRAAIKIGAYPTNRTGIGINGRRSFTVQFKVGKVLFIKRMVAIEFIGCHGIYSCLSHRLMGYQKYGAYAFYSVAQRLRSTRRSSKDALARAA